MIHVPWILFLNVLYIILELLLDICSSSFTVLDSVDLSQDDNGLSSGSEEGGLEYDSGEGSGSLPECDVTGI